MPAKLDRAGCEGGLPARISYRKRWCCPPLFRVTPGFMDRVVTMVTAPKIYPELWILEALAVDWNTFGYG